MKKLLIPVLLSAFAVAETPTPTETITQYCALGSVKSTTVEVAVTDGAYKGIHAPLRLIQFECTAVVKLTCDKTDGQECANAKWDGDVFILQKKVTKPEQVGH